MSTKKLQLPSVGMLRLKCGRCDGSGTRPISFAVEALTALHEVKKARESATVARVFLFMPLKWRRENRSSNLTRIMTILEKNKVVERHGKQGHAVIWRRVEATPGKPVPNGKKERSCAQ